MSAAVDSTDAPTHSASNPSDTSISPAVAATLEGTTASIVDSTDTSMSSASSSPDTSTSLAVSAGVEDTVAPPSGSDAAAGAGAGAGAGSMPTSPSDTSNSTAVDPSHITPTCGFCGDIQEDPTKLPCKQHTACRKCVFGSFAALAIRACSRHQHYRYSSRPHPAADRIDCPQCAAIYRMKAAEGQRFDPRAVLEDENDTLLPTQPKVAAMIAAQVAGLLEVECSEEGCSTKAEFYDPSFEAYFCSVCWGAAHKRPRDRDNPRVPLPTHILRQMSIKTVVGDDFNKYCEEHRGTYMGYHIQTKKFMCTFCAKRDGLRDEDILPAAHRIQQLQEDTQRVRKHLILLIERLEVIASNDLHAHRTALVDIYYDQVVHRAVEIRSLCGYIVDLDVALQLAQKTLGDHKAATLHYMNDQYNNRKAVLAALPRLLTAVNTLLGVAGDDAATNINAAVPLLSSLKSRHHLYIRKLFTSFCERICVKPSSSTGTASSATAGGGEGTVTSSTETDAEAAVDRDENGGDATAEVVGATTVEVQAVREAAKDVPITSEDAADAYIRADNLVLDDDCTRIPVPYLSTHFAQEDLLHVMLERLRVMAPGDAAYNLIEVKADEMIDQGEFNMTAAAAAATPSLDSVNTAKARSSHRSYAAVAASEAHLSHQLRDMEAAHAATQEQLRQEKAAHAATRQQSDALAAALTTTRAELQAANNSRFVTVGGTVYRR